VNGLAIQRALVGKVGSDARGDNELEVRSGVETRVGERLEREGRARVGEEGPVGVRKNVYVMLIVRDGN